MTHSESTSKRHYLYTDLESHIKGQKEIEEITFKKTFMHFIHIQSLIVILYVCVIKQINYSPDIIYRLLTVNHTFPSKHMKLCVCVHGHAYIRHIRIGNKKIYLS